MLDQAREFLKRIKRDLKKLKILPLGGRIFQDAEDVERFRHRLNKERYREPTVHERLGALADSELKAWVDAYDAWKASNAAQWEARRVAWDAEKELGKIPGALNPPIPPSGLDAHWNPLAPDEDFFISQAA